MERYGLRVSLLAGYASQVVMITLSVVGVHLSDPHVAYGVVWAGQVRRLPRRGALRGWLAAPLASLGLAVAFAC